MVVVIFDNEGKKVEEWHDVTCIEVFKRFFKIMTKHDEPCCHTLPIASYRFVILG